MSITTSEVYDLIEDKSQFFGVTFLKKDGSERKMTAHLDVKKHLRGGNAAYNFKDKNLVSVWDVNAYKEDEHGNVKDSGYRSFSADRLIELRTNGEVFRNVNGQLQKIE